MKTSYKLLKKLEKPRENYTNILEQSVYVKYIHLHVYISYIQSVHIHWLKKLTNGKTYEQIYKRGNINA